MKKAATLLAIFIIVANVFLPLLASAQAPEKMSYQAVIRNNSNNLVTKSNIGIQVSILQNAADGPAVYVERHFPTTNVNGLVTLEIGDGTIVSGDFTTIDWENGPYFIKTETDLNGGANYTITGTSQLLSVPYALHSKTAETVTGTISESDPLYAASQAAKITTDDITNLSNLSGTNTGDQDLSGFATKTALADSTAQVRSEIPSVITYSVGDFAQGGIVFWVDQAGQHGLVCAKTDQDGGSGVRWYAGTYGNTRAYGDGPMAGEMNTAIIIAAQVAIGDDGTTYAARICNELQITESGKTYSDWYLPSKAELSLMYSNFYSIAGTAQTHGGTAIAVAYYWSSSEYNNNMAWLQYFYDGSQATGNKTLTYRIRAVRAF
jgi:hypothetical protein